MKLISIDQFVSNVNVTLNRIKADNNSDDINDAQPQQIVNAMNDALACCQVYVINENPPKEEKTENESAE